jgi:hypothetical protein
VFDKMALRARRGHIDEVRVHVKAFTLPDVQVGSIIEFRYSLRYADNTFVAPEWLVQEDLFQRRATFNLKGEIAILQLGGKDVFLDPGTKYCPYGLLDWQYSGSQGLRQSASKGTTEFAASPLSDYGQAENHAPGTPATGGGWKGRGHDQDRILRTRGHGLPPTSQPD